MAGGLYSNARSGYAITRTIEFTHNTATMFGGAMFHENSSHLQVTGASFQSNEAEFGGAVFIDYFSNTESDFKACVFEGNKATDGGAVYSGADISIASVFRHNVAGRSYRNTHGIYAKSKCRA